MRAEKAKPKRKNLICGGKKKIKTKKRRGNRTIFKCEFTMKTNNWVKCLWGGGFLSGAAFSKNFGGGQSSYLGDADGETGRWGKKVKKKVRG